MSDFTDLIKDALRGGDLGGAGPEGDPSKRALEASLEGFDRRMRTVRGLSYGLVTGMFIVALYALYRLLTFEGGDTKMLAVFAVIFLWANTGIALGKQWFWQMQNDIAIRKELKRIQLQLLALVERERPE